MGIVLNFVALLVELACIAAIAWLGAYEPIWFAILATAVAFSSGVTLEFARLSHEMPFYFGRKLAGLRAALARIWSTSEAVFKAALAGFVALLTFSGTDQSRLEFTAVLFAGCLLIGTTVLTRVSSTWGQGAVRWGYFRLALPLGIVYSAGIYALGASGLIKTATFGGLATDLVFNLAQTPDLESASEFLFRLSQATDDLIGKLLAMVVPEAYVPAIQIVASTNVLPGFVLAVFSVALARIIFAIQSIGTPRSSGDKLGSLS